MNRSTNKNHIAHITKTTGPYKSHIPRKKKRITDVMNPHLYNPQIQMFDGF